MPTPAGSASFGQPDYRATITRMRSGLAMAQAT